MINASTNKVLAWVAGVMGTILSALAVMAAAGGYTAVQEATTELRVLNANMANVVATVAELKHGLENVKIDLASATNDRWTKRDHDAYAKEQREIDKAQDERITALEQRR